MPHSRKRPRTYRDGVLAEIAKVHRWNFCQKIAQLLYHGALTDEEIKAEYSAQLEEFNQATQ